MSTAGTADRFQQAVPAAVFVALSVWVTYISFNVDDPEPYLFPRLIAIALVALSTFNLIRSLAGKDSIGAGVSIDLVKNIAPGMAVMAIFVVFAVEYLGLYTASAVAFFVLTVLYDPAPHDELTSWVRRIVTLIGFLAVMYALFTLLLKVQTPRGLFI